MIIHGKSDRGRQNISHYLSFIKQYFMAVLHLPSLEISVKLYILQFSGTKGPVKKV